MISGIAINALVSTLIAAVVGATISSVQAHASKQTKIDKATQEAVKLMLMDKTIYLTHKAVKDGKITIKRRALILKMVDTAHDLGANGEMTECANEVKSLPTKQIS